MSVESGWEKVLPFFTEDLQALILDPTISDLMVNGTTGVYADRGGVIEHIPLTDEYSVERLEAGDPARSPDDGPGPHASEPHPQYPDAGWLTCGGGWSTVRNRRSITHHPQIQPVVYDRPTHREGKHAQGGAGQVVRSFCRRRTASSLAVQAQAKQR